jgi:hypothetical protein
VPEAELSTSDVNRAYEALRDAPYRQITWGEWCGVPVQIDPHLPPDVIELRDAHGGVLQRIELSEPT